MHMILISLLSNIDFYQFLPAALMVFIAYCKICNRIEEDQRRAQLSEQKINTTLNLLLNEKRHSGK